MNSQLSLQGDSLTFVDFCSGIGGGRKGLQNLGMKCVGFSEIDNYAVETYKYIFGDGDINFGDLMKINTSDLPNFDLMIAGFPCQPFSVIGKRNGINDDRGLVIYGLTKILKDKKVPYFILENVKGLISQNNGKSLLVILKLLEDAGYVVSYKVLDSINFGVPQSRERIYFVGIRKDLVKKGREFRWPEFLKTPKIEEYLIDKKEFLLRDKKRMYERLLNYLNNKDNANKFDVKELLKEEYLIIDTRQSDLRLYRNRVPTLRTGSHNIFYVRNKKFRKITGFEGLLLQGFTKEVAEKVKEKVPDKYLLNQVGNSMTVTVIQKIGESLLNYILMN